MKYEASAPRDESMGVAAPSLLKRRAWLPAINPIDNMIEKGFEEITPFELILDVESGTGLIPLSDFGHQINVRKVDGGVQRFNDPLVFAAENE